jgi:hypothetical protein
MCCLGARVSASVWAGPFACARGKGETGEGEESGSLELPTTPAGKLATVHEAENRGRGERRLAAGRLAMRGQID